MFYIKGKKQNYRQKQTKSQQILVMGVHLYTHAHMNTWLMHQFTQVSEALHQRLKLHLEG